MKPLTVGSRKIDRDSPVFVIAEIGVNHDGSVDIALKLVSIARECGADAVKLQIFRAERIDARVVPISPQYQQTRCDAGFPIGDVAEV